MGSARLKAPAGLVDPIGSPAPTAFTISSSGVDDRGSGGRRRAAEHRVEDESTASLLLPRAGDRDPGRGDRGREGGRWGAAESGPGGRRPKEAGKEGRCVRGVSLSTESRRGLGDALGLASVTPPEV